MFRDEQDVGPVCGNFLLATKGCCLDPHPRVVLTLRWTVFSQEHMTRART